MRCSDKSIVQNACLDVKLEMWWMLEEQSIRRACLKVRRRPITCSPCSPSSRPTEAMTQITASLVCTSL
jgi:hypothetical protein